MSPEKFWDLREMGPRICAKCMQGEVIGTFFLPPKFQHKKFAISFSLFGQT